MWVLVLKFLQSRLYILRHSYGRVVFGSDFFAEWRSFLQTGFTNAQALSLRSWFVCLSSVLLFVRFVFSFVSSLRLFCLFARFVFSSVPSLVLRRLFHRFVSSFVWSLRVFRLFRRFVCFLSPFVSSLSSFRNCVRFVSSVRSSFASSCPCVCQRRCLVFACGFCVVCAESA